MSRFEKFTVQKSYNRPGKVGILGLLAIRRINNLRIINTLRKTDPDQVHHLFNNLQRLPQFVAARAVSALQGALGNVEVRSRLLALTPRGDSTVRTSAVAVLRALANSPEVQQLLLELMKESKESELCGMYSADLDEAIVEALRGCTPPFTLALIQPLARLVSYDREGAFETLDTMLAGISASPWTGRLKVNDV